MLRNIKHEIIDSALASLLKMTVAVGGRGGGNGDDCVDEDVDYD